MEWAPAINTLTLFDITGQPEVEGQAPPECQICMERLYNPQLFPSEITTCHHRFHRDCLRNQWCNNNAGNTLEACRCPNCEQIFNCDTQLQDLTPQVNARLQELQQPAVIEAQGLAAAPQVEQIPANNLQTYTQQNYLIDRATRRFTDCITQILNDSWQSMTHAYPLPRHEKEKNWMQYYYISNQIYYVINEIIQNFKNNTKFETMLRENIGFLHTMNDRLQNPEFIQSLKTRDGYLPNLGNWAMNVDKSKLLKDFLLQCYSGQTRRLDMYAPNEQINWPGQLPDLVINRITQCYPGKFGMEHFSGPDYLNLLPVSGGVHYGGNGGNHYGGVHYGGNGLINPDLRNFQRYFQCFLDFLTALLEVNYNQAFQQQGGKRSRKTRKQGKIVKRVRKTKVKGKK
jgi:hypothetical protein